jgi:hypothetical protein
MNATERRRLIRARRRQLIAENRKAERAAPGWSVKVFSALDDQSEFRNAVRDAWRTNIAAINFRFK